LAPSPLDDPRRANIDAAVRRLPLLEGPCVSGEVRFLVDYLATMGSIIAGKGGDLTPQAHFRRQRRWSSGNSPSSNDGRPTLQRRLKSGGSQAGARATGEAHPEFASTDDSGAFGIAGRDNAGFFDGVA
jgi:hypothetical protein